MTTEPQTEHINGIDPVPAIAFAPSGRCDTCVHGIALNAFCRPCEGEIVSGLQECSAERTLTALEALAEREGDATYRFPAHDYASMEEGMEGGPMTVADLLIVTHKSHPWSPYKEGFVGDFRYALLWNGHGPSDPLPSREDAVKQIAVSKGEHLGPEGAMA